jgi:hypothetical protein
VRSVADYLAKAAEFDEMANATHMPALQKRYCDIAECYRILAHDRQRSLMNGRSSQKPREARCDHIRYPPFTAVQTTHAVIATLATTEPIENQ